MYLNVSRNDNDPDIYLYSNPPETDSDGTVREAEITVNPFGKNVPVTFYLSMPEAEELALRLTELVMAAKRGEYSEYGLHLREFSRQEDLRSAWIALGMEPPPEEE